MTLEEIEAQLAESPGWVHVTEDDKYGIKDANGEWVVQLCVYEDDANFVPLSMMLEDRDAMAWLIDRVRKLERAHAWFVEQTEYSAASDGDGPICVCGAPNAYRSTHSPNCEWLKAKELRI